MTLEKIEYGDEGGKLPGWIGGPKGKAAVIVMQEWWGITDEIKRQAEYISEKQGVRVLVPDIYKYILRPLRSLALGLSVLAEEQGVFRPEPRVLSYLAHVFLTIEIDIRAVLLCPMRRQEFRQILHCQHHAWSASDLVSCQTRCHGRITLTVFLSINVASAISFMQSSTPELGVSKLSWCLSSVHPTTKTS